MELQATSITKFLGINQSATETQLRLGEASEMTNFIITDDLKLQKMFGYEHLNAADSHPVRGMWYGSISGVSRFLFAKNGHVYEHNLYTHADTDLGAIHDAFPTTFFVSNNTVYIMDGSEFYSWNGTGNVTVLAGYVPAVATASPPAGGGTLLEGINYLTGKKKQRFSADGTATVFQLLETNIESVNEVTLNGVVKTPTTDYTVDLVNGTVTFVTAPAEGTNNIEITWTKTTAGYRETITKNKYYGGVYYARHWIFGNPDHLNTRYPSGITMAAIGDLSYWPIFTESDVGDYEITDIKVQYNKQLIFTAGDSSGASAWYSTQETYTDPYSGIVTATYPISPINSKVGNVAKGQVRVIYNNPFSIWKGVYEWASVTGVLDEKDAKWISAKIQQGIDDIDLTQALTWDWAEKGQYWLCVGSKVWIYNYRARDKYNEDVWFYLELAHSPTCFAIIGDSLCFGTETGQIMRIDEDVLTFDGQAISAIWEMGFTDFDTEWQQKFVREIYLSLKPMMLSHVDLSYETDRASNAKTYTASYRLTTFAHMNFKHFSFKTNYNPQPFRFKIRARKIDYFKVILKNDGTDSVVVLSITLPFRVGGKIKGRR